MALTATATPATKQSLMAMMRDPVTEIGSVNKPNLYFRAIELSPNLPKQGNLPLKDN